MPNSINTNIAAYFAQQNIAVASNLAASNVARLSSGNRIVQASDDVTALAIGTSISTQVSALKTAQTNAAQGASLLQVADGAVSQIQSILQQQSSIANQSQAGTLTDVNRGFLNVQFQKLTAQIDAIANGTTFNGVSLIDGSIATGGSNNPLRVNKGPSLATQATITGFTASTSFSGATIVDSAATGNLADTALIGDLSAGVWSVVNVTGTTYAVSYTINGKTYAGSFDAAATASAFDLLNVESTAALSSSAKITVAVSATDITANADGDDAASIQAALVAAFGGATAYAIHAIATTLATDSNGNSIAGSAITSTQTAGTLLNGFSGSNVTIHGTGFDGLQLPPLSNFSASGFGTNTVVSVLVDGVTYSTRSDATSVTGATTISGAAWTDGVTPDTTGHIILYKNGDRSGNPNEKVDIDLTGLSAAARISTQAEVDNLIAALNGVIGTGGSAGGLVFQLGTNDESKINVNIASVQSTALFAGVSLNVSTAGAATTAAAAVATALDTTTSVRSTIGAYESQFNFASANLSTSIQNLSASVSSLLDTDIAAESTLFATNQVKLQAGISVLAQANQQLQALLKLVG